MIHNQPVLASTPAYGCPGSDTGGRRRMTRYQLLIRPTFRPIILAPTLEAAIAALPERDRQLLTQALPTTNASNR